LSHAASAEPAPLGSDRQRQSNHVASEVIAFSGLKPGDKIAEFLPVDGSFTKVFCEALGDAGHVYVIALSATTVESYATCSNVSTHILKSRNFPAPELYNSSDDPGAVYEYYVSRLPVESFVAPEPLDIIWVSRAYDALHGKEYGSPNMRYVASALLSALKPRGVLVIDGSAAAGIEKIKQEMLAAGFAFVGGSRAQSGKAERYLLKFLKP
jgi:predicted methyltransferase